MPIFRINIDREVTNWDRFTRYIEADTKEAAEEIAAGLADQANDDCPDDAGPGNFDDQLGDWQVNDSTEVTESEMLAEAGELYAAEDEEA